MTNVTRWVRIVREKNWDVKFSIGNTGPLNTDITFNNTENNLAVIILLKETNLTER